MGFVSKLSGAPNSATKNETPHAQQDITDGALDTLSNVIRVMGEESFPLESDFDAALFPSVCADFARHVENGAAVPAYDIELAASGKREWSRIRHFFSDRRLQEKTFVTERLSGYRGIVDDLVSGFRQIGLRDQNTETNIRECLTTMEQAIGDNGLPQLKAALSETITKVNDTFAAQRREYETQLGELNDRMSNLRQDLVAAREEMKRDSLTEAFNRGAFDSAISQSLNMHFVSRQPLTLLMIDLDEFKQVNDNYGHSAGDAVLRAVGECLARSFIRKNDLIARYGGDEFAVILADTSAKHTVKLVDRFLNMVRDIAIESSDDIINISCSVGFTEASVEDTVTSFVDRADKALFEAKAKGRDQGAFISNTDE